MNPAGSAATEIPPDRLFLEGIEVFAHGGVTEAERTTGQRYIIDVSVETAIDRAGRTDDIEHTISYVELFDLATGVMTSGPFTLIESRAELIASTILSRTLVRSVTVTVRKLAPPIAGIVEAAGVEITRSRS